MKTYALISQKGGAGKSTLAIQLAVIASAEGPAFLLDRDPQGTTTKWWRRRMADSDPPEWPDLLDIGRTPLFEAHKAVQAQPGVLFIDTRPAVSEQEAEAARVADIAIVPVRPSISDLEAVSDTLAILQRLGRPTVMVVNSAKGEPRARDARAVLSRYGIPVCPHTLIDRTAYNDAAALGVGVGEIRGSGARMAHGELSQVWAWINEASR